jgi:hypothetical protein
MHLPWSPILSKISQHLIEYSITDYLEQRFLTCGPRTPGGPRLFRKVNSFTQQIKKVYIRKEAKYEIENFKTLCKSEGIWNWRLKIKLVPLAWFVGAAQQFQK